MAITLRVLGQLAPAAGIETALYTCATTSVVVSSLWVCNTSSVASDNFTIRICVAGAGDDPKQLLFSAATIPPGTGFSIVAGLTLASTDVIKVTSSGGLTSFSLFGQENS